jgi:hypothetical protein
MKITTYWNEPKIFQFMNCETEGSIIDVNGIFIENFTISFVFR